MCDEAAILACCAYVDLNIIRAGLAETPETSDFTSAKRRIEARQAEAEIAPAAKSTSPPDLPLDAWLAPIDLPEGSTAPGPLATTSFDAASPSNLSNSSTSSSRCSNKGFLPASLDDDLQLLDWTGRQIAPGKLGGIPADAPPILKRLHFEPTDWLTLATGFGDLFSRIAGSKTSASRERHLRSHRRFRRDNAKLIGV